MEGTTEYGVPNSCDTTNIHTWAAYIHEHIHTYIHTYIDTYIHAYIHTCIHACMHTYTHTHTYIHTYIHVISLIFTHLQGNIIFSTDALVPKNEEKM